MSAQQWVTFVILCDREGCMAQERTDTLELDPNTATSADVRRILKRRGWAVAVKQADHRRLQSRLDFCPDHKGDLT